MEKDLWEYLKHAEKPILLYGMGNGADKIIKILNDYGIEISGVFASDGFVREKTFHGFKIMSYSAAKEHFSNMIVLLCFGSGRAEVLENIKRISAEQELYAPDVPVYGDGLFTLEFFEENQKKFETVRSLLSDEKSVITFDNIINYKISGKLKYLYSCAVNENEPFDSFLNLIDRENYLDLGAYTGDTVADFLTRATSYNSITAVEPDVKNFRKLTLNTANIKNINLINACISDKCGTALFAMNGGRNSNLSIGKEIKSVTVDSIATSPSFIKMDIEGEETNAVVGAKNTIINNKPKMQIACYHRNGDLIDIPLEVLKLRKDYKIYLRHFPCVPSWDLNYYFI